MAWFPEHYWSLLWSFKFHIHVVYGCGQKPMDFQQWPPIGHIGFWGFWTTKFSLALNIKTKFLCHITCICGVSVGRVLVILNDIQLQSTHCCHFPLGGCILADHWFTISSFNCYAVYTIISYITTIYWEYEPMFINSLWPSDTILWHRSGSTWVQVMACCLTAPSHYLNQCWLIISKAL